MAGIPKPKWNRQIKQRFSASIWVLVCLTIYMSSSCSGSTPPPPVEQIVTVEKGQPVYRPDDYLVVLDNSGSIKGEQRVILREAVKVLADIALPGDRIAVVTFDREARTVLIQDVGGDADRKKIRSAVDEEVDFSGSYSDMTAAFELVSKTKDALFRIGKATQNVIILSDGLVESASLKPGQALERLLEIVNRELPGCTYFPIGLGDSSIHKPIAPKGTETGETLLRDRMAARGGQYFHAKTFDLVYPAMLSIFRLVKDLSDPGFEPGRFTADDTIDRIIVVIPKRDESGAVLAETRDILLDAPGKDGISAATGISIFGPENPTQIHWNSSYRFFDLIDIERPKPGEWKVTLPDTAKPGLLLMMVSHTRIHQEPIGSFFANESRSFSTWIYDDRTGKDFNKPLDVSIQLESQDEGEKGLSATLKPIEGRYQFSTNDLLNLGLKSGDKYSYRYKYKGKENYFLRFSQWRSLIVKEPIIAVEPPFAFNQVATIRNYIPAGFRSKVNIPLIYTVEPSSQRFKDFFKDQLPVLSAQVFWSNPENGENELFSQMNLESHPIGESVRFELPLCVPRGSYTVAVKAVGKSDYGPDPAFTLIPVSLCVMDYGPFLFAACILFTIAILLLIIRSRRSRISATIEMSYKKGGRRTEEILNAGPKKAIIRFPEDFKGIDNPPDGLLFEMEKRAWLRQPKFRIRISGTGWELNTKGCSMDFKWGVKQKVPQSGEISFIKDKDIWNLVFQLR